MPDNGGVPRALGYSLGHWEGNDLVVDTTGFADWGWINRAGYPHSDALHVVERFHRADLEHMRLDITLNDPKAYAQPWKMAIDFTLKPDWDFAETFCRPSESVHIQSERWPDRHRCNLRPCQVGGRMRTQASCVSGLTPGVASHTVYPDALKSLSVARTLFVGHHDWRHGLDVSDC